MSVLPDAVTSVLQELLDGLMATDNTVRANAEKVLDVQWTSQDSVSMLLAFLAESATCADDATKRAFSAVLFRRMAIKCPKGAESVTQRNIAYIPGPVRLQIQNILLKGFLEQQPNAIRHKLSDAISEVAKEASLTPGSWPELIPTLFEATASPDSSIRQSAFRVFSSAPELIDQSHMEQVSGIFARGFEDTDDDVRIAACLAFVAFFQGLPKSTWPSMAPLLPGLLNSLPRFLLNSQEQSLRIVLEHLIELVELAPKLFRDMFPTIIEFCAALCKNKEMDESVRVAALELLTTFSEVSPAMCKRIPAFTISIVEITLSMLCEVSIDDENASEWNNSSDGLEDDEEVEFDTARQALDRVALRLGGQDLAPALFQYLPGMLQSLEWRDRLAALMAISSVAEGCVDFLIPEIPRILDLVLPSLNDPHSRVQYGGCNALGQMSTDFANTIQKTQGDKILPALISKLTTKSVFRVQAHAAAALVNFCEASTKEALEPYLDSLLTNLLELLQSPKRYVQEQVLTTIATIADAAQSKFIKYYDSLMPLLLGVLTSDLGNESNLIKAKCIECSTLIAYAVGKEKFAPDYANFVQIFGAMQEQPMEDDNPIAVYLGQGWSRICKIVGKDFLPLIPLVLPPILEAAKASQDITLVEEDEAEELQNNEEYDVIQLSGKLIAIHTAVLDEKVAAIDLLRSYAVQLESDFFPWIKEIIQDICIPALEFYLHDGVRGLAALTLASLLNCSVAATGRNSATTLELWAQISSKLVGALTNEPMPELLVAYYTALVSAISILGANSLTPLQLESLAQSINANLTELYERFKTRESEEDEYAEENEENDDDYTDDELLEEINRIITAIFQSSKVAFLDSFQTLAPTLDKFVRDENPSLKMCGISILCDAIEHCGSAFDPYYEAFGPLINDLILSPLTEIRVSAALFIGTAAQYGGEAYQAACLSRLEPLFQVVTIGDARSEENVCATENCVTAIAKICHRYSSAIPSCDDILQQWVRLLPITQDETAAPFAYMFLSELMDGLHSAVTSQMPSVVESVIQALAHASIKGTTAERVVASTRQMLSSIPQSEAVGILNKNANEAEIVQRWFS